MTFSLIRSIFANSISYKLQFFLKYYSMLLFIMFSYATSIAVRNYVNDSLSISLIEPETAINNNENYTPEEYSVAIYVTKGDTLSKILSSQKLAKEEIEQILNIPDIAKITSSLKIGQKITFDYDYKITENSNEDLTDESRNLSKITIDVDKIKKIEIIKEQKEFIARSAELKLDKFIKRSEVAINSNFIEGLKSLGLSINSILELVNAYSYQIDFQRQIKSGDTIAVITEKFVDKNGDFSHHGKVLFASLNASGKEYNIYRYSPDNAVDNHKFFSEDGKSVQRSLLRTPLKLIRVTSHYGNRKHPIAGYTKMHKGVDFAAPIGTPIYAAGDGVITEICHKGGYGKFIQIKHTPTLSTAYAHASKFATGIKVGSKIKQGQIIAYVGITGRTTGAHLHYEVKVDGKHVNPMSIKTTPNVILVKNQFDQFQKFKNDIKLLNQKLIDTIEIAAN